MISESRPNNQGVVVGCVEDIAAGGVVIRLGEELYRGDVLEIMLEDSSVVEITSNGDFNAGDAARLNAPKSRRILKGSEVLRTRCNYILEDIRKNILEKDNRIAIDGLFKAAPGERISFTLNREMAGEVYSATAYGEVADKARLGAPDVEKIRQKLGQLGETNYYFKDIQLDVSEDVFIPASALKKLRREALELLDSEVLSRTRKNRCRRKDKMENPDLVKQIDDAEKEDENYENIKDFTSGNLIHHDIKCKVGVLTEKQLEILLEMFEFLDGGKTSDIQGAGFDIKKIGGIYVSLHLYKKLKKSNIDRLKLLNIKLFIELPFVVKDDFDIDDINPDLSVVAGIYIRNIGGYAALKASKLYEKVESGQLEVVIGSSLYAYNQQAVEFIGDFVYENPQELNIKELAKLYDNPGYRGELLIYGYQQVMISAQCVMGNFGGCAKDKSGKAVVRKITDDKNNVFYSRACCDECVNVIYNGVPYSIMDKLEEINTYISPESYRINFTIEDADTMRYIVQEIIDYNICGKIELPEKNYTAGHIYRGVE
jgi:putative protease